MIGEKNEKSVTSYCLLSISLISSLIALNSGRSAVSVHSNSTDSVVETIGPGPFQPAKGKFPVDLVPGCHGVGRNLYRKPKVEQLEGSLGHADMGFDAHDRDVPDIAAVELLQELGHRTAMKRRFRRAFRDQLGDGRGRGA